MMRRALFAAVLALAVSADAAELGRLFFTAEQRAALDRSRKQTSRADTDGEFTPPPPPVPQNITVTGLIRRSDGKHTIWLNQHAVNERQSGDIQASVAARDNRVRLKNPDGGRSVEVKVGQTVEILSGTIEENYARRTQPTPAANAAAGAAANPPNATKAMAAQPPPKSDALAQRRTPRAADDDAANDARPARRMEAK